ncbi:energy transducer TonB [Crocosphaera chwakensis]|uniref:TonB C-terminal domain-containing protein n=1 Tax=Crocosphaera chwakensis CCY0110 TaxID=391612 RepID=A3IMP9_9CHRO|nr:energy transducer TonB [Crocosphaera chwakensis]EAZ92152.1 hypothetical protein CY0110_24616 [Crocosphaera chwakensis CCY0110]
MTSSYFQNAPIRIFNSNFIPTLVSVGLHGLALFLLVPYVTNLPTSESEGTDQGPINVPLIELNPSEQSRLPEDNSSLSSMPEFPNSTLGDLPMLDSPSLESSLPNNFDNLPTPPALPPLPPLNSYNDYSRIPVELPPRRSFPSNPPSINRTPLPPPSLQTPTPKTPPIPDTKTPEMVDPRQNIDFGDPTPARPNNPLFQGDRPNNQNPLGNNPSRNPQISRNPNNNPIRRDEIVRNLLEDTLEGADNLTYNPQGTKREDARDRDLEWMQQTGVTLKPSQMMTIKATYPKAACNLKLEGSAIYNVLVNNNGQLRKPPFMTRSSGYGLLNNQGLQTVRSRSFPQSTRVKVLFEYDPNICGTGVAEGERNNQPQASPSATPNTPAQPNPTPQTPQNQAPSAPPEPKTPTPAPENSTNSTPKTPIEPKPPIQPNPTPQTPQNQAPSAPPEPKTPTPAPENSTNSTPKTPIEPKPPTQTPQNQAPSAPPEPKTPTPAPENSTNSIPKTPIEPKPPTQTPQNQSPPAPPKPKTPTQSPKTSTEPSKSPNSSSDTKVEIDGPAAPRAGKK